MPSKTYAQLQLEIATLQKQAEEARKREIAEAIAEVKALMKAKGVSLADLAGGDVAANKGRRKPATAQFKDPVTGSTWSGRGRTPTWLAEAEASGKSRESFRIG
jgi:DNA-binding protein H-NS